ncbi:MAG: mechanosensitive ion channel family protein [Crenarchaeota archaeon]|nr:MAG: mechanosensitive ion channel family protein [Thermoproteota archaeon]RDJ34426.1 MAG: mechanosensitive ion channel family protein [Thermoproteota archaeon]RDJ34764.1 MAG: mechanosensitive ion channel family protein [Thermoproteota archaeon]RDJ38635.1 MAG: mechanosensitive ion channel family protein [Thermoproteota archaeon]
MAEGEVVEAVTSQISEFETISGLLASSESLQIAFTVLIVGIIGIVTIYRKFSQWTRSQKFHYTRPHIARFVRVAVLPFFAIALVSSTNAYIQTFELFDESAGIDDDHLSASETFAKILNTMNILVIGYAVAHLIPIILKKHEASKLEYEDYENWREKKGFEDDEGDLFHKMFRWIPPKHTPEDLTDEEFQENLKTEAGIKYLESFHTSKGASIGSYEQLVKDPFEEWKRSERAKYQKYYQQCVSGDNEAGKKLLPGKKIEEIYQIDIWREEKRVNDYDPIIAGAKPPGYAEQKRKDLPKSVSQILPLGIFAAIVLGVISWWGVDLWVLATATGGFSIGLGLALQETMQNWFAYILIRKDRIVVEGDRVQLESGFGGYIHKITSRVTFVRHALNESIAIIPTRQLVNAQILNYSKDLKMVPAMVNVGVSYLNDPKQVASILVKVGKRTMNETVDEKGKHLVLQKRCPYIDINKPSCGCDKALHVDLNQPIVRFNEFNDSALDFTVWVYVRDYGAQFKTKTTMRMIMYEEFKKYDIRIPWPIRTVYQGDEKREAEEIGRLDSERRKVLDDYGLGDIGKGGSEE